MTSKEYWLDREHKRYLYYTNQVEKVSKELQKQYVKYRKELLDELKIMTLTVKSNNTKSNQKKLELIQDNIKKVDVVLDELEKSLDKIVGNYVVGIYIADKTDLVKALQKAFPKMDITFKTPNVKLVEELVRSNYWSGLTFSQRLYHNNSVLKYQLKEVMQSGVIKGQSYSTMAKVLASRVNSNYKDTYRLVKTEMKAAVTHATLDTYKQCNVEYCMTITSGKDNVCPHCKEKANKKIRVDKAKPGVNIAPYHPLCTCSIIPVVSLKLTTTDDVIEVD